MIDPSLFRQLENIPSDEKLIWSAEPRFQFVHNHHRWALSVLHWAQENGIVDKPCTLVSLDAHRDWSCCQPDIGGNSFLEQMQAGQLFHELLSNYLPLALDDVEWIALGGDLGMIGDMILVGGQREVEQRYPSWDLKSMEGNLSTDPSLLVQDFYGTVPHQNGGKVRVLLSSQMQIQPPSEGLNLHPYQIRSSTLT